MMKSSDIGEEKLKITGRAFEEIRLRAGYNRGQVANFFAADPIAATVRRFIRTRTGLYKMEAERPGKYVQRHYVERLMELIGAEQYTRLWDEVRRELPEEFIALADDGPAHKRPENSQSEEED